MDTISLLTPDKTKLIEIPHFLRDFYIKQNYLELPKNKLLKKILVFINLKILRFFRITLKIIFNSKFYFTDPKNYSTIIFDKEGCETIKSVLTENNIKTLITRIEYFNEIFLSKKIFTFIILNFMKRSLRLNYLFALISIINPKRVITFNDHSMDFHLTALNFKNSKIKFLGIQQAGRSIPNFRERYENFYIPHYFTFGRYEKDITINKINTNCNYRPIGSLNASLALKFAKKKEINIDKKLYDICLISEPRKVLNYDFANFNKMNQNRSLIVEHAFKFCSNYNKKIIFSGKADFNSKIDQELETKLYQYFIPNTNFKITFNDKKNYGTYIDILQSDLIIGSVSSMLQEAMGYQKKVLYCDFENNNDLYPSMNGIGILKDKSYESFKESVLEILKMSFQDYLKSIDKDLNYYCYDNSKTCDLLRKELNY